MAHHNKLFSINDLARSIAKQINQQEDQKTNEIQANEQTKKYEHQTILKTTVTNILNSVGKIINSKYQHATAKAPKSITIPLLGTLICDPVKSRFVPSHQLTSAIGMTQQSARSNDTESFNISLAKIAEANKVQDDLVHIILTLLVRTIGSIVGLNSGNKVAIDLKLDANIGLKQFLLIQANQVDLVDKFYINELLSQMGNVVSSDQASTCNHSQISAVEYISNCTSSKVASSRQLNIVSSKKDGSKCDKLSVRSLQKLDKITSPTSTRSISQKDQASRNSNTYRSSKATSCTSKFKLQQIQTNGKYIKNAQAQGESDHKSLREFISEVSQAQQNDYFSPKYQKTSTNMFSTLGMTFNRQTYNKKRSEICPDMVKTVNPKSLALMQQDNLDSMIQQHRKNEVNKKEELKAEREKIQEIINIMHKEKQSQGSLKQQAVMSLKERLMQQRTERQNKDLFEKMEQQKFQQSFFLSPREQTKKTLITPTGSRNESFMRKKFSRSEVKQNFGQSRDEQQANSILNPLAQETFKILNKEPKQAIVNKQGYDRYNQNIMERKKEDEYHMKQLQDSMNQFNQSMIDHHTQKRKQQNENKAFWDMQIKGKTPQIQAYSTLMEPKVDNWNNGKQDRHALEIFKKRADQIETRKELQKQMKINQKVKEHDKQNAIHVERQIIDEDKRVEQDTMDLLKFKKDQLTRELKAGWQEQLSFNK